MKDFDSLNIPEVELLPPNDLLPEIHKQIIIQLNKANEIFTKGYNLRSRERNSTPGQLVYVRQHHLSDKSKHFSAKLAPIFLPDFIENAIGNVMYKIVDAQGKLMGTYNAKDIKT